MTIELIKNILAEELFGSKICESTEDLHIVNYFYDNLLLEKLLQGEPLKIEELRKLLRKKIVNFEFIKLNHEIRKATGTTQLKYIPPRDHPKGIRPSSPKVATFYDLDKDAWRSVSQRSKEIVLKKDVESENPIVIVKDKSKIKVKPVVKERESKDPILQGKSYKYTTNRGTKTYVEILRELPNGLFQVSSPLFKTTFAIDPSRIGDEYKAEKQKVEEPKPEMPVPAVEPKTEVPKEEESTVLIPKEIETPEDKSKEPPLDITPEEEGPEELTK